MYFNNVTETFKDKTGCLPEPDQLQVSAIVHFIVWRRRGQSLLPIVFLSLLPTPVLCCYAIKIPAENSVKLHNFLFVDPSN